MKGTRRSPPTPYFKFIFGYTFLKGIYNAEETEGIDGQVKEGGLYTLFRRILQVHRANRSAELSGIYPPRIKEVYVPLPYSADRMLTANGEPSLFWDFFPRDAKPYYPFLPIPHNQKNN